MDENRLFHRYSQLPTRTDWEIHKTAMANLYINQNMPLREVIDTIKRQYGFYATPSMYKKQFLKWKLSKNIRSKDKEKILKILTSRAKTGKDSELLLSGRRVEFEKIARYSKKLLIDELSNAENEPTEVFLSDDLMIHTPPPIATSLPPPESFQAAEEVLYSTKQSIEMSFHEGCWKFTYNSRFWLTSSQDQSDFAINNARRTFALVKKALDSEEPEVLSSAFRMLSTSLDDFPQILKSGSPMLIPFILELSNQFGDGNNLAPTVQRFVRSLSGVALGEQHPISVIIDRIFSDKVHEIDGLTKSIFDLLLDTIIPRVGPDSQLAMRLYLAYSYHFDGSGSLNSSGLPIIDKYKSKDYDQNPHSLTKVVFALCDIPMRRTWLVDADQMLIHLYASLGLVQALSHYSEIFSNLYTGSLKYVQGNEAEAAQLYAHAFETSQKLGWDTYLKQCALMHLMSLQRSSNANVMQKSLLAALDDLETRESMQQLANTTRRSPSDAFPVFDVAILCMLETEAEAILDIVDEFWHPNSRQQHEEDVFIQGLIGEQNVVIAYSHGPSSKSLYDLASRTRHTFPEIKLAIAVGVCGGVPYCVNDSPALRLGDLVISTQLVRFNCTEGVTALHQQNAAQSSHSDTFSTMTDNLLKQLESHRQQIQDATYTNLKKIQHTTPEASYPGFWQDYSYIPSYPHKHRSRRRDGHCNVCENLDTNPCKAAAAIDCRQLGCDSSKLVRRAEFRLGHIDSQVHRPSVHFGRIASGDSIFQSGDHRDKIAHATGAIAFDVGSLAFSDIFPTLVIKGVSNYADGHRTRRWQRYAAAISAAGLRAVLDNLGVCIQYGHSITPFQGC